MGERLDLVLPLRRFGSGVTHLVAIRPESLGVGHFVTDFLGTEAPVVSLCMAHLNGTKVWMRNGKLCVKCSRTAESRGLTVEFYEPYPDELEEQAQPATPERPA